MVSDVKGFLAERGGKMMHKPTVAADFVYAGTAITPNDSLGQKGNPVFAARASTRVTELGLGARQRVTARNAPAAPTARPA